MASSNLLNLNEIRQLTAEMGDSASEIMLDLVELLEHDATRSISEMQTALEQGDSKRLKQAAHRLKGSSASLGAALLASLCQELENVGMSGDIASAASMVEQVEQVAAELLKVLREMSF